MYFYLKWEDKRPTAISILEEKPDKINFEGNFKIRKCEHTLCGYINPEFKDYKVFKLPYQKTNYLLSHLQKAVRLMDDIKSIKTAKHLIDLDYNSFIRRIPIIMLEDVNIHNCFPVLVWLMIANTKGFHVKQEIVKWLLGVVCHLSKCGKKTNYSSKDIEEIEIDKGDLMLQSLRFRKAYGGMKGDMNMIEYYIHLLNNKEVTINNDKIPIIRLDIEPLYKKEWIIEANDFHCNRYILEHVSRHYKQYKKEHIKKLIWIFSSSKNKRVNDVEVDPKLKKDWVKISNSVRVYQKNCIFY